MPESPTPRNLSAYSAEGFDRGASLFKESMWCVARCMFFDTLFPWPSSLRVALLRLFGARVGSGVIVRGKVNITMPWRVSIGSNVWLGDEVFILSLAQVAIEDSVCLSQRAFLCTGSHDYSKPTFDLITKPITLRRGSWIAAQAFVGPGVEVGEGAVVGAGSVILESVTSRVLVRGNPAVVVKSI